MLYREEFNKFIESNTPGYEKTAEAVAYAFGVVKTWDEVERICKEKMERLVDDNKTMKRALESVLKDHNDDCLLCAVKDKIVLNTLSKLCSGK